jgi:2-methylcitrate dehydratase PrpD
MTAKTAAKPDTQPEAEDTGKSRTDKLVDFVVGLGPKNVPASAYQRASELVIDHLAGSLHGLSLPWSQIIADYVEEEGGRADAVLYGRGRVSARNAALANGTIAHGIELDDTHDPSLAHPGAVVIPAALAVAELTGASGTDFLTAIIAGYEVQTRAGASLTGDLILRGFHPTAISGVWGASAAAAHLLRLSGEQLQSAWGLAESMASGVMKFTQDPHGTMVKRMHAGLPSHNGVMAAQLAAKGFRGPSQALSGKHGFPRIFSPHPDEWRLDKDLGVVWAIENISVKFYSCCRLFHAMIDAIDLCKKQQSWKTGDIAAIEAFGPRLMSDGHMEYRPQSVMSAQYSLPYTVAAALLLDPRDPRSFNDEAMHRKDLLALADLVTGTIDPKLEREYPAKYAGGIRIRLNNGQVIEQEVMDSIGTPAKPADRAAIEGKFHALTDGLLTGECQEKIFAAALGLSQAKDVRGLTNLLGKDGLGLG